MLSALKVMVQIVHPLDFMTVDVVEVQHFILSLLYLASYSK